MKSNDVVQVIYSVFLGLAVVAFVGVAISTFYPQPVYSGGGDYAHQINTWSLVTSAILLACATGAMTLSLFLPAQPSVLPNGVLLGGVFTMMYAIGVTFGADSGPIRLGVVAAALAVSVWAGWYRFTHRGAAASPPPAPGLAGAPAVPTGTIPGAPGVGPAFADPAFAARLDALERKLQALGRALED